MKINGWCDYRSYFYQTATLVKSKMVKIKKAKRSDGKTPKQRSTQAKKAGRSRKAKKLTIKRKKAAKKAASKNAQSEENFAKRLRKRGFVAHRTGKAPELPDILAYRNKIIQFYEIKPSNPSSTPDALLKKNQAKFIKDYCIKKRVKATLVYYKGSRPFKYHEIGLTSKNIGKFVQGKNSDIKDRTEQFSYK